MNNLSAAKGDSKGEINLQWDSVQKAVSYIVEIANADYPNDVKWKIIDIISDPKYTVKKLRSNKNYFFRVVSVCKNGSEKLSRKILKKAP